MNKKANKKITHQNIYFKDDYIDLFSVIETLLKFKLMIITFSIIATFVGLIFYLATPKSFEITTEITPAKSSVFYKYFQLNKNIELSENYYSIRDIDIITESEKKIIHESEQINNLSIFENTIDEFNDYEEVKEVLNQLKTLDKIDLSELDEYEKIRIIDNYAKNFQFLKSSDSSETFTISIIWHDPKQGSELLDQIITLVLQNVKTSLVYKINQIPEYLKFTKESKINLLEKEIFSILNLQKIIDDQRILHLTEQAEIARTMGLQKTLVQEDDNFETKALDLIDFNYKNSTTDYLRGYDILEREREILQNRTQEELLLSNQQYSKIKNKIDLLLNDSFEVQIYDDIDIIINDSPYDWINYNLELAKMTPRHQSKNTFLLISFLLGLTLSSIFILIFSSYQNRKISLTK